MQANSSVLTAVAFAIGLSGAIAQKGTIITKSITIVNGDTIVQEDVRDLGDLGSTHFFESDTFPDIRMFEMHENFDLTEFFDKGIGGLQMQIESFDFDSLLSQLDGQRSDLQGFFEQQEVDSLLAQLYHGMDNLEFDFDTDLQPRRQLQSSNTVSDRIQHALNRDGLLLPDESNKVELSGKHLKINGDKQPANIHDKYKRMWVSHTGITLGKKDRITLDLQGKSIKRSLQKG